MELTKIEAGSCALRGCQLLMCRFTTGNIKTEGILNGNLSPAMYEVDRTSLASPVSRRCSWSAPNAAADLHFQGLNFQKKTLRGSYRETRYYLHCMPLRVLHCKPVLNGPAWFAVVSKVHWLQSQTRSTDSKKLNQSSESSELCLAVKMRIF